MDTKALIKLAVAFALAGATTAGSQFLASDHVNFAACVSAAITAVVTYLQSSPLKKS